MRVCGGRKVESNVCVTVVVCLFVCLFLFLLLFVEINEINYN